MTGIHKATADDFEKIFPLLQEFNNPNLTRERWQQLFTHRWNNEEDFFGFYAEENGDTVGFLGTLFSERLVHGKRQKFCNLTTWIVKENYRGMSLMLLMEVLKLQGYTFTNFTANKVARILKLFGFKELAHNIKVLFPIPNPAGFLAGGLMENDLEILEQNLTGEIRTVFLDHKTLHCSHILIQRGDVQCYLLYDVVKRKRLPVARIHFISDPDALLHLLPRFAMQLCWKTKTCALLFSEHLLRGKHLPWSFSIPQRQSVLYKSDTLIPDMIPTIYSEYQVLGILH